MASALRRGSDFVDSLIIGRTSGLPGAFYNVRVKLNVLVVEWWGLCPHNPCFFLVYGYLITYNTGHAVLIVSGCNTVATLKN